MPDQDAPPVQIFGYDDSQATRRALRFFKERRVAVSFVDLRRKPIAAGELRRFVERLGACVLLLPLARLGNELTVGRNEEAWARWAKAG